MKLYVALFETTLTEAVTINTFNKEEYKDGATKDALIVLQVGSTSIKTIKADSGSEYHLFLANAAAQYFQIFELTEY